MTYPTATYTSGANGSADPQTVNLPSYSTGDLLLVVCRTFSSITQTSWTFDSSTSKFSALLTNYSDPYGGHRVYVKYRIMEAGDSGTSISVDLSGSGTLEYVIVKVAAGTFDSSDAPALAYSSAGVTKTGNPPNLAPGWGTLDILWIVSATTAGGTLNNNLSNYTSRANPNVAMRVLDRSLNASSEDPGTITSTNTTHLITLTMAIKPFPAQPRSFGMVIT